MLRDVAELRQQHQVADLERRRHFAQLFRDLVRAADEDVAALDNAFRVLGGAGKAFVGALAQGALERDALRRNRRRR